MTTECLKTESLTKALSEMGIHAFSEIQAACMPDIRAGCSVLIDSPTGSGKTLAYLLPLLDTMTVQDEKKHLPAVLILVPTRELAVQTASVIRSCLKYTEGIRTAVLTGGTSIDTQIRSFRSGADIVIGTPARLRDHLRRHTLKTGMIRTVVLDEADRMAEMGFMQDVRFLLDAAKAPQHIFLTATPDDSVRSLAKQYCGSLKEHSLRSVGMLRQQIEWHLLYTDGKRKNSAVRKILDTSAVSAMIFCNTRGTCDFVHEFLKKGGMVCGVLHSETDPKVRRKTMEDFRSGKLRVLIGTDALSRGIDVPDTGLVILYDMPAAVTDLIHRTGRTARRFHTGTVWVFAGDSPGRFKAWADENGIVFDEYSL